MEREPPIEKITAEIVDSLVASATSACTKGNYFLNHCGPVSELQKQQHVASKNTESFAVVEAEPVKLVRKTSWKNIENDVMQIDDLPVEDSNGFIQILPDCEIDLEKQSANHSLKSKSSKHFSESCDSFDECRLMITSLLDTFDTDFDNQDCVQPFELRSVQEKVSNFSDSNQTRSHIHRSKKGMLNRFSLPIGNTEYCVDTKVIDHQSVRCDGNVLDSSHSVSNESLNLEIDDMVKEIISNNIEMLSCCQVKKNKSKTQPSLQTPHVTNRNWKASDPATPECSNSLADLKLRSTDLSLVPELSDNNCDTENIIPLGWLNTQKIRNSRPNLSVFPRSRSRSDDFAYCGPLRETSIHKNDGPITSCSTCLQLRHPEQASDIAPELLYSGVIVSPGVFDKAGNSLVYVFTNDILWQKCRIGAISLAQYILYLTNRLEKISLVLDCKNYTVSNLKTLLEAFNIVQNNRRVKVERIFLLSAGNVDDLSTFQSVLNSLFKCESTSLTVTDELFTYVDSTDLLSCFGGKLDFSQAEWAKNRLVVDSFVAFCENVRRNFSREAFSMTSQPLPPTAKETQSLLELHQREMTSLLDDRQVTNLHDRSRRILEQLSDDVTNDASFCTQLVQSIYAAANDAIAQFVRVADDRLIALEHHLLVKQFEESCEYIQQWYASNMKVLTEVFPDVPDSFEELRKQRAEFDAFYISAMTEYAKCDCVLSEVEQLNDLGYFVETELSEKAKLTEKQVKELVFKMERKKEEVEIATQMYQFIDKAYSWALEGMKFVAMLNMNECSSPESCQKMLNEFDEYMKQHPAIPESAFNEIQELCRRQQNTKCLKQFDYAKQKCNETADLFNKRRELIAKMKAQQFKSSSKKRLSFRFKSREKSETIEKDRIPDSPSTSIASRSVSLGDDESVDDVSLFSYESSSGFDELSVHTIPSSPSSGYLPLNELTHTPKMNPKPARKMLKKSLSMPSRQISERASIAHVHSKSGVPLTIGSPVQVEEEIDCSGKTKVALIIEELIATEKEYVKSLNYVIKHYFPEMCKLDLPQALRCKRNIIFGNIEKIAEFHTGYFLRDLEKCDGSPLQVAKTFQAHKESFSLYALYSKNKPQSDQLLQEHGNEFFKAKQVELEDKMDLASYLLKPVQRMGKYALLLHAMSKQCKAEEERCLREAEELVKFQLRHGNDLLTMDSIRDCDVNLKEQGNLLRQEQFVIYCGRRKIIRRVFLFEELILFSKPIIVHGGHDAYQYKGSYKTAEIGMTENIGDSGFKFEVWFRRRRPHQSPQDTYVFQCSSKAIKVSWVDEIKNLLWKQALQNKDHRKKEMTSMGVGSKPHLDLALSSENRITDRSVIATPPSDRNFFSQKLPRGRTRVSIAVPSFEYVAQQSKRPHSTISTSSSTSSMGSGTNQSSSLVSSMALASYQVRNDAKSITGFSPPMAYCDFHAITEDLNEDCETVSESDTSVSTSHEENSDATCKSPGLSRQYVTTV